MAINFFCRLLALSFRGSRQEKGNMREDRSKKLTQNSIAFNLTSVCSRMFHGDTSDDQVQDQNSLLILYSMGIMIPAGKINFAGQNLTNPGIAMLTAWAEPFRSCHDLVCETTEQLTCSSCLCIVSNQTRVKTKRSKIVALNVESMVFWAHLAWIQTWARIFVFFRRYIRASIGSCGFPRGFLECSCCFRSSL